MCAERPELLKEASERLADDQLATKAAIRYLLGTLDEKGFEAGVAGKSERDQCYAYFSGTWFAALKKKHEVAKKYYERLSDVGAVNCRVELEFAKKFHD